MDDVLILEARKKYHKALIDSGLWILDADGIPSNADIGSREQVKKGKFTASTYIAQNLAKQFNVSKGKKKKGTSSGTIFEEITAQFIEDTFPKLQHLRPGDWTVLNVRKKLDISSYAQYEHLEALSRLSTKYNDIATVLGNDYLIKPDIVVYRGLCDDAIINNGAIFVDDSISTKAALRKKNGGKDILHASISAKWTMRSDRAQNSRTEALNMIRNRKGNLPHVVVVTAEPLPTRLASLALGTGDLDCVYHFALYELIEAVKQYCGTDPSRVDMIETLENLVEGKRLKDISDLPLDLSV